MMYTCGANVSEHRGMSKHQKQRTIRVKTFGVAVAMVVLLFVPCCRKKSEDASGVENRPAPSPTFEAVPEEPVDRPKPADLPQPIAKTKTEDAPSLTSVIRQARGWGPAFTSWHGKAAPDFVLTDVNDKTHRLSDYRGMPVMVIFWATWCGPCLIEIPQLMALRNSTSEDQLAMLAISKEPPALVKRFAAEYKLNYTVLLDNASMPAPYSLVNSIPSSFFIEPDGKIKIATMGLIPQKDIKAILQAEWPE